MNAATFIPMALRFSLGGRMPHRLELRGAHIYWGIGIPETACQPSVEQWRRFREALDKIGVWQWKAEYVDHDVLDGVQWSLEIAYGDRTLRCYGSNSYPTAEDSPDPLAGTDPFQLLMEEVDRLLGQRAFAVQ